MDPAISARMIYIDIIPDGNIVTHIHRRSHIDRAAVVMTADIPAAAIDGRSGLYRPLFNRSGFCRSRRRGTGRRNGPGRRCSRAATTDAAVIESLGHAILRTGNRQRQ